MRKIVVYLLILSMLVVTLGACGQPAAEPTEAPAAPEPWHCEQLTRNRERPPAMANCSKSGSLWISSRGDGFLR